MDSEPTLQRRLQCVHAGRPAVPWQDARCGSSQGRTALHYCESTVRPSADCACKQLLVEAERSGYARWLADAQGSVIHVPCPWEPPTPGLSAAGCARSGFVHWRSAAATAAAPLQSLHHARPCPGTAIQPPCHAGLQAASLRSVLGCTAAGRGNVKLSWSPGRTDMQ